MGPGLFFAFFAATSAAHAERAVGLEAQGVDPLVALSQAGKLDVRDALGRPVSARLIEAQLKQAQAHAAAKAAFASTLPQAAAMAAVLEMLEALRLALRGGATGRVPQRLYALPPSARASERFAAAGSLILVAALIVAACCSRCSPASFDVPARGPSVLRC